MPTLFALTPEPHRSGVGFVTAQLWPAIGGVSVGWYPTNPAQDASPGVCKAQQHGAPVAPCVLLLVVPVAVCQVRQAKAQQRADAALYPPGSWAR